MKRNMKKIIAFLCAIVLLVTTILNNGYMQQAKAEDSSTETTEVTPVTLEGYTNLTISDFLSSDDNTQMEDKTYAFEDEYHKRAKFYAPDITNFDKVLFSMYVKFGTSGNSSRIEIGGVSSDGKGYAVYPNSKGNLLFVDIASKTGTYSCGAVESSQVDGITTFTNTEFLLQIGFEYGEVETNDSGVEVRDAVMHVYVNGTKYSGDGFTISDWKTEYIGNYLSVYRESSADSVTLKSVEIASDDSGDSDDSDDTETPTGPTPVTKEGFTNLTISDFVDSSGAQMPEDTYTTTNTKETFVYSASGYTDLNKVLLSMKVTFSGGGDGARLEFGGAGINTGFCIYPNTQGNVFLRTASTASAFDNTKYFSLGDMNASTTEEFLLQIGIEYGDFDDDELEDDAKIYVFVNGNEWGPQTVTDYATSAGTKGNYLGVYVKSGSSLTVKSADIDTLAGYNEVTISDFQDSDGNKMEAKRYEYISENIERFYADEYSGDNFDNTVVSMNVKFEGGSANTRIDIGGINEWSGLQVYSNAAGDALFVVADNNYGITDSWQGVKILLSATNLESFLNTKFKLQLTFNFGEIDSTTNTANLFVRVYINGEACGSLSVTGCKMAKFGNYIGLYRAEEESVISVGSIDGDFPYKELTFYDFRIYNKTYEASEAGFVVSKTTSEVDSFAEVMLTGDILLDCSTDSRIIWGGTGSEKGLEMVLNAADGVTMYWRDTNQAQTYIDKLYPNIAGVTFRGEKYTLGLSAETVDHDSDGVMDDLKIGIWFNGNLYNSGYFYIDDRASELGTYFNVYCNGAGDTVTFNSDKSLLVQPDENYEEITFFHYGVDDGTYEWYQAGDGVNADGSYIMGDSINKTVLCGDVLLTKVSDSTESFNITLGGTSDNVWKGITLSISNSGNLFLIDPNGGSTPLAKIAPGNIGLSSFIGEEFNLMWSIETGEFDEASGTDTKVGIWINGILCNGDLSGTYAQDYIIISGYGDSLENRFGVAGSGEDDTVTLNSIYELTKLPDKSFDKVTFSDFGIENGQYDLTTDKIYPKGTTSLCKQLDKVVFSGDIRISDSKSAQKILYGGDGGWNGLSFKLNDYGNFIVSWYVSGVETPVGAITPSEAGLDSFIQQTFNLMISTELVDNDDEGEANDIKICLWFNKIRYTFEDENDYHIIEDKGASLQNGLSITGNTDTSILLRSVAEYQQNPYYYGDISTYRSGDAYTYPTLDGYVFAGWYADEDYETPLDKDVTSGDAYAKFIDEDVLSVKAQVKLDDAGTALPTEKTDLRFVTSVDSLEYRRISFYITKEGSTEKDAANLSDESARLVYEELYAVGSDSEKETYKPTVFSWQSDYFKTFTVRNIPAAKYATTFTVVPYWITVDGTTVKGIESVVCVNDHKPTTSTAKSNAYSFDFLGSETMPITGYHGPYLSTWSTDTLLFPNFVTDEYVKMIADSGVNVITCSNLDYNQKPALVKKLLQLGEKYGVGIYVKDSAIFELTTVGDLQARIEKYSDYESFLGMYLVDEPKTSSYKSSSSHTLASDYASIVSLLDELNIHYYVNLYPVVDETSWSDWFTGGGLTTTEKDNYSSYVSEVYSTLSPDVLSWDIYPFTEGSENENDTDTFSTYFWNIDTIRTKAQTDGKAFWAFVQAGAQWNDDCDYMTSTSYWPNEYQFDWNVNTNLAFGAQGISYFQLVQATNYAYGADENHWDFNRNSILGAWGNKTKWYDYAQEINKHIGAIDSVLMNSVNKGVIASGTNATTATSGLSAILSSSDYATYKLKSDSISGDMLIGCFDYQGKTALYVVNYNMTESGSQNIVLNFTGNYDVKAIQNAETTEYEDLSTLTLSMAAGEGVLLVLE